MAADTLRLFFAVRIPRRSELVALTGELERWSNVVRAVGADKWHLTLRFLGDTSSDRLAQLDEAGRQAVCDLASFRLQLKGVGTFSARGRPSVLWVGIEPKEGLQTLVNRLNKALTPLGFITEDRPFRPHLTIGRFQAQPSADFRQWLDRHREWPCGTADIDALELIRSQLGPSGSVYSIMQQWPLSALRQDQSV